MSKFEEYLAESATQCNWCGKSLGDKSKKWGGKTFCDADCMDEYKENQTDRE